MSTGRRLRPMAVLVSLQTTASGSECLGTRFNTSHRLYRLRTTPWSATHGSLFGLSFMALTTAGARCSLGEILCVNKCLSSWKGRKSKCTHASLPHKTKIARKPEGKGTELKLIADGDTGILLGLDLVESVQRQRQKAYRYHFREGAAVVLRLSEQYRGSVVADSAFSSVKTLEQLKSLHGLFFMEMVKTARKEFPDAAMIEWFSRIKQR